MSGSVFSSALLHQLVGDHQELHDSFVKVEVFEAFEQVSVLLAVASSLNKKQDQLKGLNLHGGLVEINN